VLRKVLLVCGILSSQLYVATEIFAALQYKGYSYAAQGVSELNAVGAPTRPFTVTLFTLDNVLLLAFGVCVWTLASRNRALRFTAAMLVADAIVGQLGLQFFNMDPRTAGRTPRTAMHETVTGVEVLVILLAIGFGAAALGKRFRFYSIATLLAVLVCGAVTFWIVETHSSLLPRIGVTERINIYAYMLWKLVGVQEPTVETPICAMITNREESVRRPSRASPGIIRETYHENAGRSLHRSHYPARA
jgi:uncharacterized protein DUF998